MGYSQIVTPAYKILDEDIFLMAPVSIRIREVRVTSTNPHNLLKNIRINLDKNYSNHSKLMTAFYRETIKQDNNYINVSEAVMEVLKAPYHNTLRNDVIRLIKGRKSPDVQPFQSSGPARRTRGTGGPVGLRQINIGPTAHGPLSALGRRSPSG